MSDKINTNSWIIIIIIVRDRLITCIIEYEQEYWLSYRFNITVVSKDKKGTLYYYYIFLSTTDEPLKKKINKRIYIFSRMQSCRAVILFKSHKTTIINLFLKIESNSLLHYLLSEKINIFISCSMEFIIISPLNNVYMLHSLDEMESNFSHYMKWISFHEMNTKISYRVILFINSHQFGETKYNVHLIHIIFI